MEQLVLRLSESRDAVLREGQAFLQHTKGAGRSFVSQTAKASEQLKATLEAEVAEWQQFIWAETASAQNRTRRLLTPSTLERHVLSAVDNVLTQTSERIHQRLSQMPAALPEKTAKHGEATVALPIPNYEALNAREIVALLDDLDEEELDALKRHETRGKARATILKAIKRARA